MVNLVLFRPRDLDDRGAVGGTALAPPGAEGVEAVLNRLVAGHVRKLPEPGPVAPTWGYPGHVGAVVAPKGLVLLAI